jgi:hypothetical protein
MSVIFSALTVLGKAIVAIRGRIDIMTFNKKCLLILSKKIDSIYQYLTRIPEEEIDSTKLQNLVNLVKDIEYYIEKRLFSIRNLPTLLKDAPNIHTTINAYNDQLLYYLSMYKLDRQLEMDLKTAHKADLELLKKDLTSKLNNQNNTLDQILKELNASKEQDASTIFALSKLTEQNVIQNRKVNMLLDHLLQRSGRKGKKTKPIFTQIPWDRITLDHQQPIGRGSYGEIFKGKWNHFDIVVKQSLNAVSGIDAVEEIEREISNWSPLVFPNIARLWGGNLVLTI